MLDEIDILVEDLLAYAKTLHPDPEYPNDHKAAMRVPKGGSNCSSCRFVSKDKKQCSNEYFIKWNGSRNLPLPADEYCSDWYEPKEDLQAYGTSEGVKKEWDTRGRGLHDEEPKYDMVTGVHEASKPEIEGLRSWKNIAKNMSGNRQQMASARKAGNVAEWIAEDWKDEYEETSPANRDSSNRFFVVDSQENGVVGAVHVMDAAEDDKVYVGSLVTRPDVITGRILERGVGTKLMIQVAKYAASRGRGVMLGSLSGAEGFYRKIGMHETDVAGKMAMFEWSADEAKQMAQGKVQ